MLGACLRMLGTGLCLFGTAIFMLETGLFPLDTDHGIMGTGLDMLETDFDLLGSKSKLDRDPISHVGAKSLQSAIVSLSFLRVNLNKKKQQLCQQLDIQPMVTVYLVIKKQKI